MTEQDHLFKKKRRRRKGQYKNVSVRPTPEDLAVLHARAASFGFKSLSRFLIERALREGEMIVSADRERIERILFEVRKIGNNLNQLARWANSGGRGLTHDKIERAAEEVERVVGEVGEALNG
jgi:hypothetical protein